MSDPNPDLTADDLPRIVRLARQQNNPAGDAVAEGALARSFYVLEELRQVGNRDAMDRLILATCAALDGRPDPT